LPDFAGSGSFDPENGRRPKKRFLRRLEEQNRLEDDEKWRRQ
jgi:hypothetical protein